MTCRNCGAEVKNGAVFCPHCGTKLSDDKTTDDHNRNSEEANFNTREGNAGYAYASDTGIHRGLSNRTKGIILVAAAVVLIAVILIIILSNGKPTINLNDYLTVTSSGYNGYGTAEAYIDTARLEADYRGKLKLTSEGNNNVVFSSGVAQGEDPLDLILPEIDGYLSKESNLSNGDKITYIWNAQDINTIETYINVDLNMKDYEYTVTGLKDVKNEDIFAGVSITFSGVAPDGEAAITVDKSENRWVSEDDIELNRSAGLSNGDIVTVSISDSVVSGLLSSFGIAPIETSKEFSVSGLSEFITSISQVPEDKFSELENEVYDALTHAILDESATERTINDLSFVGCYLLGNADDAQNELVYVYHINTDDSYNNADHTVDYYSYKGYKDVVVSEDGICNTGDSVQPEYTTDWFWGNVSGEGFNMDYNGKTITYRGFETLSDLKDSVSSKGEILDSSVTD